MKRRDFQDLAAIRLNEAKILLHRKCWDGAYYLGGYAVECALKACIAKLTARHEFPDRDRTQGSFTHDLLRLLKTAELDGELKQSERLQPRLAENRVIVRSWSGQSRYERHSASDAEELMKAITDREFGILPWLEQRW